MKKTNKQVSFSQRWKHLPKQKIRGKIVGDNNVGIVYKGKLVGLGRKFVTKSGIEKRVLFASKSAENYAHNIIARCGSVFLSGGYFDDCLVVSTISYPPSLGVKRNNASKYREEAIADEYERNNVTTAFTGHHRSFDRKTNPYKKRIKLARLKKLPEKT